jgi:hypothetical protein
MNMPWMLMILLLSVVSRADTFRQMLRFMAKHRNAAGSSRMREWGRMTAAAFTRKELFVVLAVIAFMTALVLPAIQASKRKRDRIQCAHNLTQVGLGWRTFAIDHGGSFFSEAATNGEARPAGVELKAAFEYFRVPSNELVSPKLLVCPADVRVPAKDFGPGFSNTNLSYFVGVDAQETNPQMLLCGDRNLTNGLPLQKGILVLSPGRPVGWTDEMHHRQGNIGLADGSVQGFSSSRLSGAVAGVTNRLLMP